MFKILQEHFALLKYKQDNKHSSFRYECFHSGRFCSSVWNSLLEDVLPRDVNRPHRSEGKKPKVGIETGNEEICQILQAFGIFSAEIKYD